MSAAHDTTRLAPTDRQPPVLSSATASLLNLHSGLEDGPDPTATPQSSPTPIQPSHFTAAQLRSFYLLRKDAPEEYLSQFRQMRGRLLRIRAQLEARSEGLQTLLVTSPEQGDGRTFTASNLALMLAVIPDTKVLLLDLNLGRPSFEERFSMRGSPGLRSLLQGADWRTATSKVPAMELYVASLGARGDAREPLDYFALQSWLDQRCDDFDWIILDGPEVAAGPDAELLAHVADGTLLVARAGSTSFHHIHRSLKRLTDARMVGFILNQAGGGPLH